MKNKVRSAEWYGFNATDSAIVQYLLMKEENFTIKDIGISYTELNYWDKKELLPIVREIENGWRKFNFIDIVWLGIIRELRSYGISTALIKAFKESVFSLVDIAELKDQAKQVLDGISHENEKQHEHEIQAARSLLRTDAVDKEDSFSYFEYWLLGKIVRHESASLLFFISGEVAYWNNDSDLNNVIELRQQRASDSHIVIPIDAIICDLIEENLIVPYLPYLNVMSVQEGELLNMINHGKYDSITVTFKNNRPDFVLTKKALPAEKRKISEVLLEGDYQTIRMVQHKGKVTVIENEKKIPFNDLGKNL